MSETPSCGTCRFLKADEKVPGASPNIFSGLCVRHAPRPRVEWPDASPRSITDDEPWAFWPRISDIDDPWCGEWQSNGTSKASDAEGATE